MTRMLVTFSLGVLILLRAASAAPLAEIRVAAGPRGDELVPVNPPPLLWPAATGKDVRYAVRLSNDPKFPPASTITATALRWAMFNPHQKLAPGTWHWQYGAASGKEAQVKWSEVNQFRVDATARVFVTPPARQVLAACPSARPCVLATAAELPALRRWLEQKQLAEAYATRADNYLKRKLPDLAKAEPKQAGKDDYQRKVLAKWASKGFAKDLVEAVSWLVPAYLATGKRPYAEAILERGLFVAALDPEGVTSPAVSDFADGSCMRAMAYTYDTCYELLTPAQRRTLAAAMEARGKRFFGHTANRLEGRLANAHIWQHILMEFTELALAARGDLPDADEWLAYVYELWVNRFPVLGGDDGGWAEGLSYFGSNSETLVFMPALWGRLSGVSFFAHPWYRQVPYFHIYGWPPDSASDGFGDGAERSVPPRVDRGLLMAVLSGQAGDPYAAWYAQRILADKSSVPAGALLSWRTQVLTAAQPPPQPKPPADLPLARAFGDVGVVAMHTDLVDAAGDLMLGFRSSPYGAYGHAHACQNAFNLNFGGQHVFSNSGYYIAYGDEHFRGWYSQTRAHNSVLIDGRGQVGGLQGCGSIARFVDGRQISYCQGDASQAYGDAGLTRFRRQVALLRPNTVLVYDELAARHPARWSWLLHSPHKLTADGAQLATAMAKAQARATLYGSTDLGISIDTRFDPPAENWHGKKAGKTVIAYPDQWHARAEPREKCREMRFLAVLQVGPAGAALPLPSHDTSGRIVVGPWRITAEMHAARPVSLLVEHADGQAALAADRPALVFGGKTYEMPPGGVVLREVR